jgi:uncharacterized integral membrane protein
MQFIRTLFWVLILAALLIFTAFNWKPVEVQIWTSLVLETKLPVLIVAAFLLGLVPTWLIHRGTRWRLNRRIGHLEAAARGNAVAARPLDDFGKPSPESVNRPLP